MYINKFILWFVSEAVSAQIYPGWFIPYILFAFALLSHKSCNYNCPDVRIDKETILFLLSLFVYLPYEKVAFCSNNDNNQLGRCLILCNVIIDIPNKLNIDTSFQVLRVCIILILIINLFV